MPTVSELIQQFDTTPSLQTLSRIADRIEGSGRMEDDVLATALRSSATRPVAAKDAINKLRLRG